MTVTPERSLRRVMLLGNHVPRQCGIATFTTDLADALRAHAPRLGCSVVAMNDVGKHYAYPAEVGCQIAEESLASYRRAADFLNVSEVDLLSVQHEYGIFGGKAGGHLLTLLRAVNMPVVTTLHTVLEEPSPAQRTVMWELCDLSTRVVVMSRGGAEILARVYRVPSAKIDVIHHGVPELPDSAESRRKLGLEGKRVLLTLGLLSPSKGVEYAIDALEQLRARWPDIVYVVLGATHPHVKEQQGESYRLMLEARGHALGLDESLRFYDRFVNPDELVQFLSAADVYLTPYLNPEQITSGTLAYAVGAGKAVVSTRYRYAEEILADGRGRLVAARDSRAIAAAVSGLLGDPVAKAEVEQRARALGEEMHWPVVARAYVASFARAVAEHVRETPAPAVSAVFAQERPRALPEINLGHLRAMTDDTGLLQHAVYTVPRYEDGYCLDDNARALLVMAWVEDARVETPAQVRALSARYLAFVRYAFDGSTGRFRNLMSFSRRWIDAYGSEDSHGRAVWALGTLCACTGDGDRRAVAAELLERALPALQSFTSPRAWAYALLGIVEYVRAFGETGGVAAHGRALAIRLLRLFEQNQTSAWRWCEDRLTYANARLPQALILAGRWLADEGMIAVGLRALEWLDAVQVTPGGLFAPVGSNGFFTRGGDKAEFDQQPIEACGMTGACLLGFRVTGKPHWRAKALRAFNWFLGENELDLWLYDPGSGGCYDGLHRDRRNQNQGAEATLSFLMALLELRQSGRLVEVPALTSVLPQLERSST